MPVNRRPDATTPSGSVSAFVIAKLPVWRLKEFCAVSVTVPPVVIVPLAGE